jgi:adenosylcobinamide kinase / adenosylcobinamide-phosphate guanylyltransferase
MSVTLVLGGARSGKSRFAESLAHGQRHYVATAQILDEEMRDRIEAHRAHRGNGWTTHEECFDIAALLRSLNDAGNFVLVDCLTLWLSNLMLAGKDWEAASDNLCSGLKDQRSEVIFVSNEVGLGIVPDSALGREFRDAQGLLNQQVATVADNVVFVAAGLPMVLKGTLPQQAARQA